MSDHTVQTTELGRDFGENKALDGLNLTVSPGTILTLLGPNGAGKTTLLRILIGLIEPTRGQAFVLGAPSRSQPASVAGRVAYVGDRCEPPNWATVPRTPRNSAGTSVARHTASTGSLSRRRSGRMPRSGCATSRPIRARS